MQKARYTKNPNKDERLNVALLAKCMQIIAAIFRLFPNKKRIVLISRQSGKISESYKILREELLKTLAAEKVILCLCEPETKSSRATFLAGTLKQLYYASTSSFIVIDGYVPAVCIPKKSNKTTVLQAWHSMGAVKKFGFQCVGTSAGRSAHAAHIAHMHENYDIIAAAGPGAIDAFAQAFNYPKSAIKPIGMLHFDYILNPRYSQARNENFALACKKYPFLRGCGARGGAVDGGAAGGSDVAGGVAGTGVGGDADADAAAGDGVGGGTSSNASCSSRSNKHADASAKKIIIYAPTLRKGSGYENWAQNNVRALASTCPQNACLVYCGHPLETNSVTALESEFDCLHVVQDFSTIDILQAADLVITDYSAIAFDAALLNKNTAFYVPDIEKYKASPGLNINLEDKSICVSSKDAAEIMNLARCKQHAGFDAWIAFCKQYFADVTPYVAQRYASIILEHLD